MIQENIKPLKKRSTNIKTASQYYQLKKRTIDIKTIITFIYSRLQEQTLAIEEKKQQY